MTELSEQSNVKNSVSNHEQLQAESNSNMTSATNEEGILFKQTKKFCFVIFILLLFF